MAKGKLELYAIEGQSFDVPTYQGYGRLCDLASISAPDTFDEQKNPKGYQRDLDKSHATSAYKYAALGEGMLGDRRLWSEIVLNVRDTTVLNIEPVQKMNGTALVKLSFELEKIDNTLATPKVARVDGNHRLHFAQGVPEKNWGPVEAVSPFLMTIGLDVETEQALFKDINDNQKGMNTSHLDHIVYRSRQSAQIQEKEPELWIAERLAEDPESPFHGLVYRGGAKDQGTKRFINLRSLKNGVELILNHGHALRVLPGPASYTAPAQYSLIRNYWKAVEKTWKNEWNKDSLLLKGVGYRAMSVVGGYVIDRCLASATTDVKDMEAFVARTQKTQLDSGQMLNWEKEGPLGSFGGMKGVGDLADQLLKSVTGIDESSVGQLAKIP